MAVERASFDRWIVRPQPDPAAALRLVCLPYAGGGASVYHGWAERLPLGIELWIVRPPGREVRLRETPISELTLLVRDLADVLASRLVEPFALFGHSMGALVAFELARELRRRYRLRTAHLVVSARPAPHLPLRHPAVHVLGDEAMLDALARRYNGVPQQLLDDRELARIYAPVLRADMATIETYRYQSDTPFDCPLTAFGGDADPQTTRSDLDGWRQHTSGRFAATIMRGDHFFLHSRRDEIVSELTRELVPLLVP